ncbi:alpha/beta fold hydrolase [Aliamphritea spongicola]|uniref:alpha/beta fold hydrolase n=1 Tax=Aliamphritea spongicola TaxID=707589 RepID=UPI00196A7D14|nr:alpha/beta hydrolase [Aliamphritea spongicola]MBN3560709.1 alpha/beta hydrolase [Aliamphritea spongicola]
MSEYLNAERRQHYYAAALNWQEGYLTPEAGGRIHYIHGRHGSEYQPDKPVLVLLHEALGHLDMWKDFPSRLALATGLDVFAYERQGYGGSGKPDDVRPDDYLQREALQRLGPVLNAAGLESVILVGHSDGGSIALVGAAELPDRVKAIVTMAAHVRVDPLTRRGVLAARRLYKETDLPERLARYHGDHTDQLFWLWNDTWLRDSFQGLDLSGWLSRVECPALIMQGVDDQYGEPAQVDEICTGINSSGNSGGGVQAEALMLEDCRHIPHLEAKDACVAAISDFVTCRLSSG